MDNTDPTANLTMGDQTLVAQECHIAVAEAHQPGQAELPHEVKLQSPMLTNVTQKNAERIPLKKRAGMRINMSAKWISAIIALFGIAIIGASFMMGYNTMLSLLLSLEGVSVFVISILFYFVTPHRLVRSEVCDAEVVSSAELVNALLAPITGDSKGIYLPSSRRGATTVFIPTNNSDLSNAYGKSNDITKISVSGMDGIFITPPGYGLLEYAKSLGAVFTDQGLEEEITDVLVNGTELAPWAEVRRKADSVNVRISGLTDSLICKTIRQKRPMACYQVGCPICSFVACMVTEGTGKLAMISDVKLEGKALDVTYKLL